MVARYYVSRRTGYKESIGVPTASPDCPIRKKEAHNQRGMKNTLLKGKVADSVAHNHMLMEEVHPLIDAEASIAVLLSG